MQKAYTHPSDAKGPTYIGNKLVNPGETVFIEVAGDEPAAVEHAEPVATDVAALQKLSIAKIKDQLDTCTDLDLQSLLALEQASDAPRATLVAEIDAELLKRKVAV